MSITLRFFVIGILCWCTGGNGLRADVLEMQNGDRYSGKVLAVSADVIVLNSEILGRVRIPRSKVATLTMSENGSAPKTVSASATVTNAPPVTAAIETNANVDLSAMLRQLGGDTNFIAQIRQQMFAGNPQAAGKYDELVNQLLSGQMNLADLRRQAQASAQQLRDLKRGLGPDADEALDAYMKILDAFVNETGSQPDNPTSASPQK